MQKIDGPELKIKLDKEMVEELDRMGKRLGLKRNQVIRNFLDVGIYIFSGYEKVGVVKMIEIQRRFKKTLKEDMRPSLF